MSNGSSSQVHRGVTPEATANIATATSVMPRLKSAVSATDSGTARRGKRTLRSRFSRSTSDRTDVVVDLDEELEQDEREEDVRGVVRDPFAEARELGEDDVDDPEERERARQRPHVAEDAAVEAQAPFGDGEDPREAPEPPEVVARERPRARRGGRHVRSISIVCGRSAMPPVWRVAVEHQRRQVLANVDRLLTGVGPRDGGRRRVAAGSEPVLDHDSHADLVAGREVAGGGAGPARRRREDRVPHLVAQADREDRLLERRVEADVHADRQRLALLERRDGLAA